MQLEVLMPRMEEKSLHYFNGKADVASSFLFSEQKVTPGSQIIVPENRS
jgi:hypothetical protein